LYTLDKRNSLFLRVFHWLLVLLLLVIVPTGFYIHQPFPFLHINFGNMFAIHVFCGFALSYLLMARAYYAMFNKNYQTILFSWQDFKELPSLLKYYLFFQTEKPPERKYNAGQRLIYTAWFVFLSLANISGAMAYKKSYFVPIAKALGGLHHLDWATLAGALLLSYTVPLHIYLSLTENMGNLQAMVTGYSYKLELGGPAPKLPAVQKTRAGLPGLWLWKKFKAYFKTP
jgi:Ni/Fe-hydrogenase 1 B-type cytochrome subunit